MQDHFYKSLDKHGQGAFDEYGWTGIWTSDIKRYIRDLAIEPPKVPTYGYSLSTAVIKEYKAESGEESRFVTRTRSMGPAVPRDYVATPSDPDADHRFQEEFVKLVSGLHASIKRNRDPDPSDQPAVSAAPTP